MKHTTKKELIELFLGEQFTAADIKPFLKTILAFTILLTIASLLS